MKHDPRDWHPAEIKAALWKKGITFKGLALDSGYKSVDAISQCLHRRYPRAEAVLAAAIGVRPEVIWPSRYPVGGTADSVMNKTDSSKLKPRANDIARAERVILARAG